MGLNWGAGLTAIGQGLGSEMMKAKEKQIDVELENIRQDNYARLRRELAKENRDWNDSRDERMRGEELEDRQHEETREVATGEKAHERALELQRLQNEGRTTKDGGIFGNISASGVWTPESMEAVQREYNKTGVINYDRLQFAVRPEAKQTKSEFQTSILEKLSSMNPDLRPSQEEIQKILDDAGLQWDTLNKTSGDSTSTTGSVFESKDFGNSGRGSSYRTQPGSPAPGNAEANEDYDPNDPFGILGDSDVD